MLFPNDDTTKSQWSK